MNTPVFPDKQQNLDQFIEKVEQLERKRRRHIGQISLVALAVLGGISTLFWQMNSPAETQKQETFRTYLSSELNPENIRTLFDENQQKIIVRYDGTAEADTVASVREYLAIFHPFPSAPVVEGSIVSSESSENDEWDYQVEDDAKTDYVAERNDDRRNNRRKNRDVPTPMTPAATNENRTPEEDNNKSLLASGDETSDPSDDSGFNPNEIEESFGDDFSELAFASAENNDPQLDEEDTQGSVRARNLPPANTSNSETTTTKNQSNTATASSSGTKSLNEPLEIADRMPSFPGGTVALQEFLDSRLAYPAEAREHEIEGKVYIRFVVNADGSLSDFRLMRGIGFGCDEEALRVAKSLPKWIPGRQGLTRVPVKYTLPIRFKLQ